MTNKSEDQIPKTGYFSTSNQRRGCCSSDGGSAGSSCTESQEDRRRNDTEEEEEARECQEVSESETEEDEGMNTVKRKMRPVEPVRPPRVIDGQSRLEYYNLCHPPPVDPPAIPRRKPFISHLPTSKHSDMVEPPTTNTDTLSSMASRNTNLNKKKYQNRRKKGHVCSCKHSGINT